MRGKRRRGEDAVKVVLALCALVSVATTVGIVIALRSRRIEFFREISVVDFITGPELGAALRAGQLRRRTADRRNALVTFWACLVAMPFGLGAAIYLSEYARPRDRATLKPALEVLAGIPTVVFGYFALTFVTPLLRDIGIDVEIFNALARRARHGRDADPDGRLAPEDAMAAVPRRLRARRLRARRESCRSRRASSSRPRSPGSSPRYVLAISRAIGETMIVLIAAGQQPNIVGRPARDGRDDDRVHRATGAGDVADGSIEYKTIFAVGLTLFVMTLAMNVISIRLVRKYREVYE